MTTFDGSLRDGSLGDGGVDASADLQGGLRRIPVARPPRGKLGRDFVSISNDLLFLWDLGSVSLACALSALIFSRITGQDFVLRDFWSNYGDNAIVGGVIVAFIMRDRRFNSAASIKSVGLLLDSLFLRGATLVGVLLAIAFTTNSLHEFSRGWFSLWAAVTFTMVAGARVLRIECLRLLERRGVLSEVVAIVGSGPVADRLVNHLELVSQGMTQIVGIFDDRAERVPENSLRPCGSISDLVELGRERQIDWIIVTLPWSAEKRLLAILRELKNLAVDVALCPQQIGLQLPHRKVEYMGDLPVMLIADRPLRRWAFVLKQMEDKILGGLITLATLPLMGLVALAIRLDSPGPIIFRQWRHGWNNSEFEVYKFRTMRHDKAQPGVMRQTARNDSRITRVGGFLRRTSLDELPQLFNVLKGDMSLVGPRPHPTVMRTEEQLGHEIVDEYAHRHRVKPGITGWAQVNGLRGATMNAYQLQKRIEYDLYYIENWSLLLDFKILLMTSLKVMSDKNAF